MTQRSLEYLQEKLVTNPDHDITGDDLGDLAASVYHHRYTSDSSIAGSVVIDARDADTHELTLTGNVTAFSISNGAVGQRLTLILVQGGSGSYTLAGTSGILWEGAVEPTLTTTVGRRDVFTFIYNGDDWVEAAQAVQDVG